MGEYEIKPLTSDTWDAFADLCERNNGAGIGRVLVLPVSQCDLGRATRLWRG